MTRLVAALAVLLAYSDGRALEHPRIALELDACVDVERVAVRRALSLELGDLLIEEGAARDKLTTAHTRVRVTCVEEGIELRVDDALTAKTLIRVLELSRIEARHRARLLGVSIAELVTASWSELERTATVAPLALHPPSPSLQRGALAAIGRGPEKKSTRSIYGVSAFGGVIGPFRNTGPIGWGGVRVLGQHPRGFCWTLQAGAGRGSSRTELGTVFVDLVEFSTAPGYCRDWRWVRIFAGAGLRGGPIRMSGSSETSGFRGSSFSAAFGGVLALLGVSIKPHRRIAIDLFADAGYVFTPVGAIVDDVRRVAIDGFWVSGMIGLGVLADAR